MIEQVCEFMSALMYVSVQLLKFTFWLTWDGKINQQQQLSVLFTCRNDLSSLHGWKVYVNVDALSHGL